MERRERNVKRIVFLGQASKIILEPKNLFAMRFWIDHRSSSLIHPRKGVLCHSFSQGPNICKLCDAGNDAPKFAPCHSSYCLLQLDT